MVSDPEIHAYGRFSRVCQRMTRSMSKPTVNLKKPFDNFDFSKNQIDHFNEIFFFLGLLIKIFIKGFTS